jgi:hypothetical protein
MQLEAMAALLDRECIHHSYSACPSTGLTPDLLVALNSVRCAACCRVMDPKQAQTMMGRCCSLTHVSDSCRPSAAYKNCGPVGVMLQRLTALVCGMAALHTTWLAVPAPHGLVAAAAVVPLRHIWFVRQLPLLTQTVSL